MRVIKNPRDLHRKLDMVTLAHELSPGGLRLNGQEFKDSLASLARFFQKGKQNSMYNLRQFYLLYLKV